MSTMPSPLIAFNLALPLSSARSSFKNNGKSSLSSIVLSANASHNEEPITAAPAQLATSVSLSEASVSFMFPTTVPKAPPKRSRSPKTEDHQKRDSERNHITSPSILVLHCGGTFGMEASSHDVSTAQLSPKECLQDLHTHVPELDTLANVTVTEAMNIDSSQMNPTHWKRLALRIHKVRHKYDGFVIIHGTDTMTYTGSALSFMLQGLGKPVVLTGAQRPLSYPRSDARQNLLDAMTVVCDRNLREVAVCFGGRLLRANRSVKMSTSAYAAFDSPNYPRLAELGTTVEWNEDALLRDVGAYQPRFEMDKRVVRLMAVPGMGPNVAVGDLWERGVKGAVVEAFGVGNLPESGRGGWVAWVKSQRRKGLRVYVGSQCVKGPMDLEMYECGAVNAAEGAKTSRRMTGEAAVVKMMVSLADDSIDMDEPLAGEL